jgi:hypothetical protein
VLEDPAGGVVVVPVRAGAERAAERQVAT